MVEVIICTVTTGRVQRKCFDTRDEVDRSLDKQRSRWAQMGWSPRGFRVEIVYREQPAARSRSEETLMPHSNLPDTRAEAA
jgi:hypothetical protein